MIKNRALFKKFEDDFIRDDGKLSFDSAIKLFTYMLNEALSFGVFATKKPLEGIEEDIRVAKTLYSCLKKSFPV